eukprot:g18652.t1
MAGVPLIVADGRSGGGIAGEAPSSARALLLSSPGSPFSSPATPASSSTGSPFPKNRRGRRRRSGLTAAVLAFHGCGLGQLWHETVLAFDRDGHEAIGMTAMSAIERGKVLTTMKKLLKGKDIMDISGWAHAVDEKFPWAEAMHYQSYALGSDGPNYDAQCENMRLLTDQKHCPGNYCLLPAMKHFYATVVKAEVAN